MTHCVYVTSGWGIHDDRWVEALRNQGFEPTIIRLGIDAQDSKELRAQVSEMTSPQIPVLAGPLDTVTTSLIGIDAPVVGLSWGFDLHNMADLNWLRELSGLIVDSASTAQMALDAGVSPEKITFLPWGVDLDVFTPDGPAEDFTRWGIPTNARIVLSLRAHEPRYRVADIIDGFAQACKDMADVHLIVGHSGSLTQHLKEQARDLGIAEQTHFIGSLAEEHLPTLLRGTDLYVSASEVDGTSVTLLQAMACQTPILVSDSQGNRPWVEPGVTGELFRIGDPTDFAEQLQQHLTTSADERRAKTQRARAQIVEQANWHRNIGRLRSALT